MSARSMLVKSLPCIAESWLPVSGWETCYEVSSFGRVRSVARTGIHGREKNHLFPSKVLKPITNQRGYLVVNFTDAADPTKPRRRSQQQIHILVLTAFVGPRPPKHEGCHNDGDRSNASLVNLRWDTTSGNHADKLSHGTSSVGKARPAKLTADLVRLIRTSDKPINQLARELGRSWNTVSRCRKGIYFRESP